MTNRAACKKILDKACNGMTNLSFDDLPDLPCVSNCLDEMEQLLEENGEEFTSTSELYEIAQDCVAELLESV